MKLKLKNNSSEMELSGNFIPSLGSYKKRIKVGSRYGKDGGFPIGDNKVSARKLSLSYNVTSEDDIIYLQIINELTGFFRSGLGPFYLIDTDNNKQTEIILGNHSDSPASDGLTYRIGKNKIDFTMLDGHWEDLIPITIEATKANNEILTINNDSYADCYPLITLTPTQSNPSFIIRNMKTGGALEIGSNSFVIGTKFEIDCNNGTIFLDDGISKVESSIALADGSGFITLEPGDNDIKYESVFGSMEIKFTYRRRYAF